MRTLIITELQLKTDQIEAQRTFYVERLGFPLIEANDKAFRLQAGATCLTFEEGDAACYHFAFNIPHNRFAEAKAWLKQRVELLSWDHDDQIHWKAWNAHAVYFYDPAGNVVEFIARHNLPYESVDFDARRIMEVSEIGLAAPDVSKFSTHLQDVMDLPVWDAGDGQSFTALGDEHGLFILAKEGRSWFPTSDSPAFMVPVELTVQGREAHTLELADMPYRITMK